jgi:hypothetical protein
LEPKRGTKPWFVYRAQFLVSHAERETGGGPDEMQAGWSTLPHRMTGFHLPLNGTNCAFYATSGQKFIGPKASA